MPRIGNDKLDSRLELLILDKKYLNYAKGEMIRSISVLLPSPILKSSFEFNLNLNLESMNDRIQFK